jgi:hypothetical protein
MRVFAMTRMSDTRPANTWQARARRWLALACFLPLSAVAGPDASIDRLAWMTGNWVGPAGPGTLEENWIKPEGGSIASLVRMTGGGKTSMVELIVIEEEADSLVLRVQQWNPGFSPRSDAPQTMVLKSIGERDVYFEATGEGGGMKSLGYSNPTPDAFNIHVENAAGNKFSLKLKARILK